MLSDSVHAHDGTASDAGVPVGLILVMAQALHGVARRRLVRQAGSMCAVFILELPAGGTPHPWWVRVRSGCRLTPWAWMRSSRRHCTAKLAA